MVQVLLKQDLLPVLVIDFTNQTDLIEHDIHTHNNSHRRGLVISDNDYHSLVWEFNLY